MNKVMLRYIIIEICLLIPLAPLLIYCTLSSNLCLLVFKIQIFQAAVELFIGTEIQLLEASCRFRVVDYELVRSSIMCSLLFRKASSFWNAIEINNYNFTHVFRNVGAITHHYYGSLPRVFLLEQLMSFYYSRKSMLSLVIHSI